MVQSPVGIPPGDIGGLYHSEELHAMRFGRLTFLSCLGLASPLRSQTLDANDKPFMSAAVMVLADDLLVGRCAEQTTMSADGAAKIATWVRENEIERIRLRSKELEQNPDAKKQFDLVRRVFSLPFSARGQAACKSAIDATQRADAQFARNSAQMIAALRVRGGAVASDLPVMRDTAASTVRSEAASNAATGSPSRASTPPSAVPTVPSSVGGNLAARIDRFGFDTRMAMGVGGFLTTNVFPVVLFKDGSALTEIEGLGFPAGLDAHRRVNPGHWTRWRKQGDEWQLESKGKWQKLAFRATYSTLPAGFRLRGYFSRLSGTGNVAVGGAASVAVSREYAFTENGRVVRGSSASASTRQGNASVVTSSIAPNNRGRYIIEGVTLHIRYDDGSEEQRIIVTDPSDPSVIWLDGESYTHP